MKHRINCDLFFENSDKGLAEYNNVWKVLKTALKKNVVVNINTQQKNEEKSVIKKHNCMHDESKSCNQEEKLVKV